MLRYNSTVHFISISTTKIVVYSIYDTENFYDILKL